MSYSWILFLVTLKIYYMIKHETEVAYNECCVNLRSIVATYTQDPDNYDSQTINQNLIIGTEPGGFYYIKTERWAFNDIDELIDVLRDFAGKFQFLEDNIISDN